MHTRSSEHDCFLITFPIFNLDIATAASSPTFLYTITIKDLILCTVRISYKHKPKQLGVFIR